MKTDQAPSPSAERLRALAERVEREEPSRELWMQAWEATREFEENFGGHATFNCLCAIGSWRDAAAMLMPERWRFNLTTARRAPPEEPIPFSHVILASTDDMRTSVQAVGYAVGPHAEARARLAAALRARAILAGERA